MPPDQGLLKRFQNRFHNLKRRMQTRIKGKYLVWAVFCVLSFSFLWSALAGQHGLFSYIQLEKNLEQLEQKNKKLLETNHALQKDVFLLRNDVPQIERVIREEYGYIANGEKVYLLEEPGGTEHKQHP